MRRHGLGMFADPPFARPLFAVLFGLPVLRHDVLGGQGDDFGASWAHDDGGDCWVIIEGWASRELPGEAVGEINVGKSHPALAVTPLKRGSRLASRRTTRCLWLLAGASWSAWMACDEVTL